MIYLSLLNFFVLKKTKIILSYENASFKKIKYNISYNTTFF